MDIIRRHPLLGYFFFAFGASWSYELIFIEGLHLSPDLWLIPYPFLGPLLAACLITMLTQGRSGLYQWLQRCVHWHVGWRWYLFALFGALSLKMLAILLLPGASAAFRLPAITALLSYIENFALGFLIGGPLAEEPGWRGFALPRLQSRFGPLAGTLILGPVWALWHLPLFLMPGYNQAGNGFIGILLPFMVFLALVVVGSLIFTWVFNNTQGSLWPMMLLHTSLNNAPFVFFPSLSATLQYEVIEVLIFSVTAGLLLLTTKGRLSYQRFRGR